MQKINENQKGFIRCQKLSSTSSTKVFPLFVKIAVKAGNLIKVCQLYFYLAKINHGKMSEKRSLKGNNVVVNNRTLAQMVATEPISIIYSFTLINVNG